MARITPSIAARAIEQTYPWAKGRADGVGGSVEVLGADQAATIGMILAIVDAIPDELLPFDTEGHLAIVASVGAMRSALHVSAQRRLNGHLTRKFTAGEVELAPPRHLTNVAADKHFSDAASPQWLGRAHAVAQ